MFRKIEFDPFLFYFAAPPMFLVKPSDKKASAGSTVKLDCVAAGNPTPTLFWMKEGGSGVLLPGSKEERVSVAIEGTLKIGMSIVIVTVRLCHFFKARCVPYRCI